MKATIFGKAQRNLCMSLELFVAIDCKDVGNTDGWRTIVEGGVCSQNI